MTEAELSWDNLTEWLPKVVPELAEADREARAWLGEDVGHYLYLGQVLYPYLKQVLPEPGHDDVLQRIFGYVEALATHSDESVVDLAGDVCEMLVQDRRWIYRARTYMGPATLAWSYRVEPRDWAYIRDSAGPSWLFWQVYFHVWYRRRWHRHWWKPWS